MGIDRIGKGGSPPPVAETGTATGESAARIDRGGAVEKTFSVDLERADAKRPVGAAEEASPLALLKSGAIDVDGYVERKVDEALRGIEGLSAAEVDDIRSVLRDQLASDPALIDLVRAATGKTPTPPED